MESMEGSLYLIVAIVAVLFVTFAAILSRYKRCPSDKILVVYGRTGKNATGGVSSARCIHGGAAFIWPVFQSYSFLDLTPISIECNLTNALSKQNIRVDVPCRFTVGISTEPDSMTNAAERLLGQRQENIQDLAKDLLLLEEPSQIGQQPDRGFVCGGDRRRGRQRHDIQCQQGQLPGLHSRPGMGRLQVPLPRSEECESS